MKAAFGKPSQKKKKPFFWVLPKLGEPPYPNWFGHFFKSEKVVQKVCREGESCPNSFLHVLFWAKTKVKKLPKLCAGVGRWGGVGAMPKRKWPLTWYNARNTQKKHTLYIAKKHIKENSRKEEMQNYIPSRNDELKQTLTLVSPDLRLRKMAELDVPAVTLTFTFLW